jgi:uncharacterized protein YyaL (SSP411 family)
MVKLMPSSLPTASASTATLRVRTSWSLWATWSNALLEGLLELYQTTFEPHWFVAARELAETIIAHFQASEGVQLTRTGQLPSDFARPGGIAGYDTSDAEALVARPRDLQDNATPSGNAMMATVLLKLSGLAVAPRYAELARQNLGAV